MPNTPPPPPSDWIKNKEWEQDTSAKAERSKWPDQECLKGTKDENTIMLLRHSGKIAVCLIWFFTLVFVLSMSVWLAHFLTPCKWLTELQLSKIQTVIFSGSLGAVVSSFAKKQIVE